MPASTYSPPEGTSALIQSKSGWNGQPARSCGLPARKSGGQTPHRPFRLSKPVRWANSKEFKAIQKNSKKFETHKLAVPSKPKESFRLRSLSPGTALPDYSKPCNLRRRRDQRLFRGGRDLHQALPGMSRHQRSRGEPGVDRFPEPDERRRERPGDCARQEPGEFARAHD